MKTKLENPVLHAMLDRGLYDRNNKRDPYYPQEVRGMRYSAGLVSLLWVKIQHPENRLEEEAAHHTWTKVMTDKFVQLDQTDKDLEEDIRPLQVCPVLVN